MGLKQYSIKVTKGMNQDLSKQIASPDTAYKLLNIKNQILDSQSAEALINEKGTSLVNMYLNHKGEDQLDGEIVGIVKCDNDSAAVFVKKSDKVDIIYKFYYDDFGRVVVEKIAEGNFNFGNNIKGIFCYENSELQKVYWVDGVNQLRYINIAESNFKSPLYPDGKLPIKDAIYLDSSPEFRLGHTIEVERVAGGGVFTAGVIQYAFTYYMKYGAETGIVDMTPLYYISEIERGLLADETVGCSFRVKIKNPDTRFDYLRLYSIQRTSLNGTPIVKIVKDLKLK